jgi:hypothetical protein
MFLVESILKSVRPVRVQCLAMALVVNPPTSPLHLSPLLSLPELLSSINTTCGCRESLLFSALCASSNITRPSHG